MGTGAGQQLKGISDDGMLFIDCVGNLVLSTVGKLSGQVALGNAPGFVVAGSASSLLITNGAGASSNICNVSFQVTDYLGNAVAGVFLLDIYLSDAATGIGLTATTASGGIAAVSADGTILDVLVASKFVRAQTNAAGLFVLAITDTAKTGFYPVAARGSAVTVGAQLTTASYHA